jgi:hypothetical protein
MLTAAGQSTNPFDFALVCMLGLLGLRIFETVGADIDDLGEEHGHRVLRVRGKGGRVVTVPLPPAVGRAVDRAADERRTGPLLLNRCGSRINGTRLPADCVNLRPWLAFGCRGCTRTCSDTPSSPRCSTLGSTCGTCRSRPARRPADHHAVRPGGWENLTVGSARRVAGGGREIFRPRLQSDTEYNLRSRCRWRTP